MFDVNPIIDLTDLTVHHNEKLGSLWAGFFMHEDTAHPKYWNGFGLYEPGAKSQPIVVEINVEQRENTERAAGYFARDETGAIDLLHSGKIGGGSKGVGKDALLLWGKSKRLDVIYEQGDMMLVE